MSKVALSLLAAALLLAPGIARADAEDHYVDYKYEVSVPLTAALFGVAISAELFKKRYAPKSCRWCSRVPVDETVRSALFWNYSEQRTAHNISNIVLGSIAVLGLSELAFVGDSFSAPGKHEMYGFGTASLVYLEALGVSMALNQIAKMIFMRARPYTRHRRKGSDDNVSFYSGHTSTAFVLAVGAATINDMKGGDRKYRALIWTVNLLLATSVGYFRIAADKHYFTDVVVGGLIGGAIGFLVPKLFHEKDGGSATTKKSLSPYAPPPKPVMFGFGFPF